VQRGTENPTNVLANPLSKINTTTFKLHQNHHSGDISPTVNSYLLWGQTVFISLSGWIISRIMFINA
jgi:hypothetical protein